MKLNRVFRNDAPYGWAHYCPACESLHVFAVEQPSSGSSKARWSFDGNVDRPTFHPSMLLYTDSDAGVDEHWLLKREGVKMREQYATLEEAQEASNALALGGDAGWVPVARRTPRAGGRRTICHYHLQSGMINYCADSPHDLKGKSVPLPEIPPSWL